MTPEESAKALYDACPTVKPAWERLGPATKSVWLEKVPKGYVAPVKEKPDAQHKRL